MHEVNENVQQFRHFHAHVQKFTIVRAIPVGMPPGCLRGVLLRKRVFGKITKTVFLGYSAYSEKWHAIIRDWHASLFLWAELRQGGARNARVSKPDSLLQSFPLVSHLSNFWKIFFVKKFSCHIFQIFGKYFLSKSSRVTFFKFLEKFFIKKFSCHIFQNFGKYFLSKNSRVTFFEFLGNIFMERNFLTGIA